MIFKKTNSHLKELYTRDLINFFLLCKLERQCRIIVKKKIKVLFYLNKQNEISRCYMDTCYAKIMLLFQLKKFSSVIVIHSKTHSL